jgi:hypothetical protein
MTNEKALLTIEYNASVFTQAGWRSVTIKAIAEKVSKGMAVVRSVVAIDDELPVGWTSRTGAKRQSYNAAGIAAREAGAKKRLSACYVI